MKNLKGLLILFVLIIVVFSIFSIITYSFNKESKQSSFLLIHTNKVLYQSEKVLSLLKDVETATRGFVITGDSSFLLPYNESKDSIDESIVSLKQLVKDNSGERPAMDSLFVLANNRLKIAENVLHFRKSEKYNIAEVTSMLLGGKQVMNQIRSIIRKLQVEENNLLADRERVNEDNAGKTETGLFILFGSVIFLLITVFFAARYLSQLRKTESSALTQLNTKVVFFTKRIDDIVKGISDPFFALDQNFNFAFLNAALQKSIGLGKGDMMGKNFFDVFPQYNHSEFGDKIRAVMNNGKSTSFEMFEDFLHQWQEVSIYPTSEGISITMKDIGKRKSYEKEIRQANEFLEETNQVAHVGGWEVDMVKNTVTWTHVTALIHETPPEFKPDLKSALKFYKEGASRDMIMQLVDDAVEKGQDWDVELQIVTATGKEKWVRTNGKVEFENGECTRMFGTFQDIDEQKKLANIVQQSEKQFRSAFENSPHGMALVGIDRKFIEVNDALCKIVGYPKEELMQLEIDNFTHPDDIDYDHKKYAEILQKKASSWQYEKRYIHKEGHTVWILACGSYVTDANGKITSFVSQMQDITERKLSIDKLTDEKKLLQTIIDNIPVNVYMKDLDLRKTLINKSELDFIGAKDKQEVLGKTDFDVYPEESALVSQKEDRELFASGQPMLNKETVLVKKDGSTTHFLTSKIPFKNEQGTITGLIGISYDVSWQRKS